MSSVSKRVVRKAVPAKKEAVKTRHRLPVPRKPSNGELSERALFAKPYVPTSRLDKYVWEVFQQGKELEQKLDSLAAYPQAPAYPQAASYSVYPSPPMYSSSAETDYSMYTSLEPIKTYSRQGS